MGAYINPPWSLLNRVFDKLIQDESRALLVIPEWIHAPWWSAWKQMVRVQPHPLILTLDQPIYLAPDGSRRAKPRWNTVISVIDAKFSLRNTESFSYTQLKTIAPQWI